MAYKPHYPLADVKALVRSNQFRCNDDVLQELADSLMWSSAHVRKVLLKLNDRWHRDHPLKNHFFKTGEHKIFPNTKVDIYKVINALEGIDIYLHFYIKNSTGYLIINSFKEL